MWRCQGRYEPQVRSKTSELVLFLDVTNHNGLVGVVLRSANEKSSVIVVRRNSSAIIEKH
jgi:hypothetical protein